MEYVLIISITEVQKTTFVFMYDTNLGISTLSETGFSGKWTFRGPWEDVRGRLAEDTGDP